MRRGPVLLSVAVLALTAGCASASADGLPSAASVDGAAALRLCQGWATLRAAYGGQVRRDTPYQLEQWFSGPDWAPLFKAGTPIEGDPAYGAVSIAFRLATDVDAAGPGSAAALDAACAAAG